MSDSATFMINRPETSDAIGLAALFSGVDGLARALGVVIGGGFVLGMAIVLIVAAA
jgi:hypothetical protein